jgi:hypothetical protein
MGVVGGVTAFYEKPGAAGVYQGAQAADVGGHYGNPAGCCFKGYQAKGFGAAGHN